MFVLLYTHTLYVLYYIYEYRILLTFSIMLCRQMTLTIVNTSIFHTQAHFLPEFGYEAYIKVIQLHLKSELFQNISFLLK